MEVLILTLFHDTPPPPRLPPNLVFVIVFTPPHIISYLSLPNQIFVFTKPNIEVWQFSANKIVTNQRLLCLVLDVAVIFCYASLINSLGHRLQKIL